MTKSMWILLSILFVGAIGYLWITSEAHTSKQKPTIIKVEQDPLGEAASAMSSNTATMPDESEKLKPSVPEPSHAKVIIDTDNSNASEFISDEELDRLESSIIKQHRQRSSHVSKQVSKPEEPVRTLTRQDKSGKKTKLSEKEIEQLEANMNSALLEGSSTSNERHNVADELITTKD